MTIIKRDLWKCLARVLSVAMIVYTIGFLYFREQDVDNFYAIRADQVAKCLVESQRTHAERDDCGVIGNEDAQRIEPADWKHEALQSGIMTPFGLILALPTIYILRKIWKD